MNVSELKQLNEEISRYMRILVTLPKGMYLDPPGAENADQGEPGHERSCGPDGPTKGGGVKPGETAMYKPQPRSGQTSMVDHHPKKAPQSTPLSPR